MVNHRNISAGESRWTVQLACISLGDDMYVNMARMILGPILTINVTQR